MLQSKQSSHATLVEHEGNCKSCVLCFQRRSVIFILSYAVYILPGVSFQLPNERQGEQENSKKPRQHGKRNSTNPNQTKASHPSNLKLPIYLQLPSRPATHYHSPSQDLAQKAALLLSPFIPLLYSLLLLTTNANPSI